MARRSVQEKHRFASTETSLFSKYCTFSFLMPIWQLIISILVYLWNNVRHPSGLYSYVYEDKLASSYCLLCSFRELENPSRSSPELLMLEQVILQDWGFPFPEALVMLTINFWVLHMTLANLPNSKMMIPIKMYMGSGNWAFRQACSYCYALVEQGADRRGETDESPPHKL